MLFKLDFASPFVLHFYFEIRVDLRGIKLGAKQQNFTISNLSDVTSTL